MTLSIKTWCACACLVTIMACNQDYETATVQDMEITEEKDWQKPEERPEQVNDQIKEKQQPVTTVPSLPVPDYDKKIIKTANLHIEIEDAERYGATVHDLVKKSGGYIAQEQQKENEYQVENHLTIKVPVHQFEQLVKNLSSPAKKVFDRSVRAEDVTGQVVDTRTRVEAKKNVRNRYMELLKQAKNMEEVLDIQAEINRLLEEIEVAANHLTYLQQSATYSTIHLNYFKIIAIDPQQEHPAYYSRLWQSFENGWNWFGEFFIGIVALWPLWFFILFISVIFRRSFIKKIKQV